MRAAAIFRHSAMVLVGTFTYGALVSIPVSAQVCANVPSRTIFVGGPGTEACSNANDQATCEQSFHRSGAGHLAPCVWGGSTCDGNTVGFDPSEEQSCETLPAQNCNGDPSRTLQLSGGTQGPNSGSDVCSNIQDQVTCESAWHTTPKGVGVSCCWQSGGSCAGSIWGFYSGGCTQPNTCLARTTAPAPAMSSFGLIGAGVLLLGFGGLQLRARRRA